MGWAFGCGQRDLAVEMATEVLQKRVVHRAIATGLPVLPIVSHEVDRCGRNLPGSSRSTQMEILPPIDTSEWKVETAAEHASQVREIIRRTLGPRQQGPVN